MALKDVIDSKRICDGIERIDPLVGVAVIGRDFTVKSANTIYMEKWPEAVGKVCYTFLKGFKRPCKWCPVSETLKDKRIHESLVWTPKDNEVSTASIVAVPIVSTDGKATEVVEIIIDNTKIKRHHLLKRLRNYRFFSEFGGLLERLKSKSHIPDFLLLGAVWNKSLDFPEADVFVLRDAQGEKTITVEEVRNLANNRVLKNMLIDFNVSLDREKLSSFRGQLKQLCIKSDKSIKGACLVDVINDRYRIPTKRLKGLLRLSKIAVRLSSNIAATTIIGPNERYFLVTKMVGTGHDIVTGRSLLDVGIFGSVAERAIRNRRLAMDVDTMIRKGNDFFAKVDEDAGALVFAAHVVSSFAHDLRTSCITIRNQVNTLWSRVGKKEKEVFKFTYEGIKREVDFIQGCMDRAIDVARMDQTHLEHFRKTDIHKLIEDAKNAFAGMFTDNKIKFRFTEKTTNSIIVCDPLLIKQVICNLFANACISLKKASYRTRTLIVKTKRSEKELTIIVEDNGIGIDPVIEKKIWEPFFSTKRKGKGTGLGLMICRRIVKDIHAGEIRVESRHGYGAKFIVDLPFAKD